MDRLERSRMTALFGSVTVNGREILLISLASPTCSGRGDGTGMCEHLCSHHRMVKRLDAAAGLGAVQQAEGAVAGPKQAPSLSMAWAVLQLC